MKKYLLALSLALFSLSASAQTVTAPCVTTSTGCPRVSASNPMPTTGGGAGGSTVVTQPTAANLNMTEANSAAILSAVQGAVPAGTNVIGYTSNDPCSYAAKTNLAINGNSTSSAQLIALSGSTSIYVCSLSLIAAGATTVAFTTGTGTACVTNNAAVIGSTTANIANSISLAANGGLTLGNGGGMIAKGAASSEFCMILGSSVYVAGNLTYVQQ